MKLYLLLFIFSLGIIFSACNSTKNIPQGRQLLVKNNVISLDKKISNEQIYNYIKQRENTKTAMFFNFHLWIYNMAEDGKNRFWKRWLGIYKMGRIIGEPPVLLDTVLIKKSREQIDKYLKNKGYYESTISDSIKIGRRNLKKAKVYYIIDAGEPTTIKNIKYNIQDSTIREIVFADTLNNFLKREHFLDADLMQSERIRISSILKNNGYFDFSKEYIYYQVDTNIGNHQANIELKIINPDFGVHQQYAINEIYFFNDFNPQVFMREKEAYYQLFDTTKYNNLFILNRKEPFVKPKVIENASYIARGNLYNSNDVQRTIKRLYSLNEYKLVNVRYNVLQDTSKLDVLVQLSPFSKYNYIAEVEGTNSSGNFGIGGRYTYQHKSLFKGAEILNISAFGKIEAQNALTPTEEEIVFNSTEFGGNMSLHFPKFILPFRSERFIKKYHPRTAIETSVNYKNRPEYQRSIVGGYLGYYWNSEKYFKHQFKLIELNAVKVFNMDEDYANSIKNTYLEKSFDDYLISATNYTLYFTNESEKKSKNFFTFIAVGELAGNTLNMYSHIAGKEKIDNSYEIFENIFAQYWRTELDIRYNIKSKKKDQLVYRLYGGYAHPYGNITAMPYVKQFYSGGANGMRAWPARSLGPGSYYNDDRIYYNESADFKLEGNIEYRFNIIGVLNVALFVDAGNIWSTSSEDPRQGAIFETEDFISEIAIGAGLGIRLDFSFFIFRIDYGFRIRDPKETPSERWIITNSAFNPLNGDYSMFNFGIGYPF
ncbi:MAG: BamA/TamA family outer membrane protein [Bacteroidales bacterium]|nr:BamA/TamA family outer membrane protein [Bacteroidales bacterium]